jgi:hypothetical protein
MPPCLSLYAAVGADKVCWRKIDGSPSVIARGKAVNGASRHE